MAYSKKDKFGYIDHYDKNGYSGYSKEDKYGYIDHYDRNGYSGYSKKDKYGYTYHYSNKNSDSNKSSDGCFLTTACVEYKGFADDCMELTTLRNFRDTYMNSFEEGKEDIKKYYEIAPSIVKNINKFENKNEIYDYIYENLVLECISLINNNHMHDAYETYKEFVKELYNRYCIN